MSKKPIPPHILQTWHDYFSTQPDMESRIIVLLVNVLWRTQKRLKRAQRELRMAERAVDKLREDQSK